MTIQTLKLSEIAETAPAYFKRLKGMNIQRIGSGGFSNVYEHPAFSNVVVKVIKFNDPSFLRYVRACLKHPGNPWLPKFVGEPIKAKTTYTDTMRYDYVWVVFAERLRPLTDADIDRYTKYFAKLGEPAFDDVAYSYFDKSQMKNLAVQTQDKQLSEAAKLILSVGGEFDIKRGNLMMRGRQLVFTDPVAN